MAKVLALLAAGLLVAGCTSIPSGPLETEPADSTSRATVSSAAASPAGTPGRNPATPRPTPPTLAVLPAEPTVPGYNRTQFGPAWTDNNTAADGHNGCDTRNDVLHEQLTGQTTKQARACPHIVLTGMLHDPYTGRVIMFSRVEPLAVQIDHIVPLHYAWNMGAWRWPAAERVTFANDTVAELLAVDGPQNESKSDAGPAGYMPPNVAYRCTYAQRFTDVLRIYKLPITAADLAAVGRCRK